MPNHVTNRIEASQEVIDQIVVIDEQHNMVFDFNMFAKMPENIFRGNLGEEEKKKYGSKNWYDWSINNWGTKWNAYSFKRESDTVITFETAWSHPEPVIAKLSEMFPEEEFLIAYADEDEGYNLDVYRAKNGNVLESADVEEGSAQAEILYSYIHGGGSFDNIFNDLHV